MLFLLLFFKGKDFYIYEKYIYIYEKYFYTPTKYTSYKYRCKHPTNIEYNKEYNIEVYH